MAIGLDKINNNSLSRTKKRADATVKPKAVVRPWRGELKNFEFVEAPTNDLLFLPQELENLDSANILFSTAENWIRESWHDLRSRSYWLSRFTHRSSWLARLQLKNKIRIPLPGWLTQKSL